MRVLPKHGPIKEVYLLVCYGNPELRLHAFVCSDQERNISQPYLEICRFVVPVVFNIREKYQVAETVRRVLVFPQVLFADGADQHRRTLGP